MSPGEVFLTRQGHEKLLKELEQLKEKRKTISKAVKEARDHGDISENAEYDAAKEALAMNEKAIAELQESLGRTRIVEDEGISKDKIFIGATVKLKDVDTDEELEYTLLSELEADYNQGKISVSSPIGKGLLGHKKGETVEINIPAGTLKYKVLDISR